MNRNGIRNLIALWLGIPTIVILIVLGPWLHANPRIVHELPDVVRTGGYWKEVFWTVVIPVFLLLFKFVVLDQIKPQSFAKSGVCPTCGKNPGNSAGPCSKCVATANSWIK